MDNILFRASCTGKLMTKPQNKNEAISETTKAYLVEVFVNEKYKRWKDLTTKFTEKGLQVEDEAISLYSLHTKNFFLKNEETYTNEYIKGTPDLIEGNLVIDIKCSYDIFTFFNSQAKLNKDYYWQLQSYMALTGATRAKLAYCLINTPRELVQDEIRRLQYKMGILDGDNPIFQQAIEKVNILHTFDDIPLNERVYEIEIPRNEEDIQRLYARVVECREWMNKHLFKLEIKDYIL